MERNLKVLVINSGLKGIGSILGAVVFFKVAEEFDGKLVEIAVLAGYCALGYMVGNLLSALYALAFACELACDKNTEKENKVE